MAVEAGLEQAGLRVADALHRFAKTRGWAPGSYRILVSVRPEWAAIHVAFLSDNFNRGSESEEYEDYDDVMDFLEQELEDDPGLYGAVSMILRPLGDYASLAYGPLLSPGEIAIPHALLNPGVPSLRG